mmetsp:Transcript_20263/g.49720  ORF Transcript_20263/g.49720 Transcript_20263/m.49720 type:complete len:346 (-) Transcript_20263:149-1186(-)
MKIECSIYVSNIPFDATEQQLIETFSEVGKVLKFRIINDDLGKPRGFGYCEYEDAAIAHSAVRNLNETDFHGRALKVEYANSPACRNKFIKTFRVLEAAARAQQTTKLPLHANPAPVNPMHHRTMQPVSMSMKRTPILAKEPLGPVQVHTNDGKPKGIEAITEVVKKLKKEHLVQILSEMKIFIQKDRAGAVQLLAESPQFAQMLLQIQLAFGLVKGSQISLLLKKKPAPQITKQAGNAPSSSKGRAITSGGKKATSNHASATARIGRSANPTGEVKHSAPGQRAIGLTRPDNKSAKQKKMIAKVNKVLRMTEEEVNALSPEDQKKIRKLKAILIKKKQNGQLRM